MLDSSWKRLTVQTCLARCTAKSASTLTRQSDWQTHTSGDVTSLRQSILHLAKLQEAGRTMKASATALLAGGRGNELLIQVYICRN